jgi:hypothetical protein
MINGNDARTEATGTVIGTFAIGPAHQRFCIQVLQKGTLDFEVRHWDEIDGERSLAKSTPFYSARKAFQHALELAARESQDYHRFIVV